MNFLHHPQVLSDAKVVVPPTPDQEEGPPAASSRPPKSGGQAYERPEELVPDLIKFLQDSPDIRTLPKVVQVSFCSRL